MVRVAILCVWICMTLVANSVSQVPIDVILFPIYQEGKWGYINNSGKVIIEPQFYIARPFSEGLALVLLQSGQERAFINNSGQIVIKLDRDIIDASDFSEGLARARFNYGKEGFIDKSGAIAIRPQFEEVGNFREGIARVKYDGKYGFITKTGEAITDFIFDSAEDFRSGLAQVTIGSRIGYIDKTGKYIWKPTK